MAKTTTSVKKRSKSPASKPKGASSNKSAKKLSSVRSRSKSAVPSKNQATVAPKAKAKARAKKQNFVMELFFPSSDGLPTSERVVHRINIIGWQIKVDSVAVRVCAVDRSTC
jgi:hypothetical protein